MNNRPIPINDHWNCGTCGCSHYNSYDAYHCDHAGNYDISHRIRVAPCNITPNNTFKWDIGHNEIIEVRYKCGQIKWKKPKPETKKQIGYMINIVVPWWLKPFKRWMTVDAKPIVSEGLKGYSANAIIIDEASSIDESFWYNYMKEEKKCQKKCKKIKPKTH